MYRVFGEFFDLFSGLLLIRDFSDSALQLFFCLIKFWELLIGDFSVPFSTFCLSVLFRILLFGAFSVPFCDFLSLCMSFFWIFYVLFWIFYIFYIPLYLFLMYFCIAPLLGLNIYIPFWVLCIGFTNTLNWVSRVFREFRRIQTVWITWDWFASPV